MVGTASLVTKWGYNLLSPNGSIDSDIRSVIISSLSGFTESDSPSIAYGIATRKLFHDGKDFIGSYGRSIGDENLMFYNPDKDVCITIMTSSNTGKDGSPNIGELMYAIYDAL